MVSLEFATNLFPFKLFSTKMSGLRTVSVKHTYLESPDKMGKTKKRMISTLSSRHTKFDVASTSVWR